MRTNASIYFRGAALTHRSQFLKSTTTTLSLVTWASIPSHHIFFFKIINKTKKKLEATTPPTFISPMMNLSRFLFFCRAVSRNFSFSRRERKKREKFGLFVIACRLPSLARARFLLAKKKNGKVSVKECFFSFALMCSLSWFVVVFFLIVDPVPNKTSLYSFFF